MRRMKSLIAGVGALMLLTACAGGGAEAGAETAAAGSGELTQVTIGGVVTTSTVPIYIAQSEGIFEKYGLEVTMQPTQNFAAAAPSVLNGQLNFATAAAPPFIQAIDQGMPLQAVAGTSASVEDPEMEGNQVVVGRDSGITSMEDLKGKKVATNQVGSGPYVGFLATYMRAGGSADDIEWVVMPMNEQIAALESGTIDAAVLAEPFTAMAKLDGHTALMSTFRYPGEEILEPGDAYVVVLSSEEYIAANPEVAQAMRDALIEANEVAEENPDMVIDLLIQEADLDPDIAQEIVLPGFTGELTGDELQRLGDAMYEVGLLTKPFDGAAAVMS